MSTWTGFYDFLSCAFHQYRCNTPLVEICSFLQPSFLIGICVLALESREVNFTYYGLDCRPLNSSPVSPGGLTSLLFVLSLIRTACVCSWHWRLPFGTVVFSLYTRMARCGQFLIMGLLSSDCLTAGYHSLHFIKKWMNRIGSSDDFAPGWQDLDRLYLDDSLFIYHRPHICALTAS